MSQFNIKDFIDTLESKEFSKKGADYRAKFWSVRSEDLTSWYLRHGHRDRKTKEMLFDVMHDVVVVKDIIKVINEGGDDHNFAPEFVVVLNDLIETQARKLERDEILESYEKCVAHILKPYAKELRKEVGINKELSFELLGTIPTARILNKFNSFIYTFRLNKKLYLFDKTHDSDEGGVTRIKQLRKLYNYIFGENYDVGQLAINILLEHRSDEYPSLDVYSLITVYALDTLESLEKDELRDALKTYGERRSKERDMDRRIRLDAVSKADYPRIVKAIKKVEKKNPELKGKFA